MRDITDLTVTQYRMFPIDALPFSAFKVDSAIKAVKEGLGFAKSREGLSIAVSGEGIDMTAGIPVLTFADGEAKIQGKKVVIERVSIDPRRIVLHVKGSSAQATVIYKRLEDILAKEDRDRRWKTKGPVVVFEETQCIVTLDFDFNRFFAPSLLEFLREKVQANAKSAVATAAVEVKKFAAAIEYKITDENVLAQDITLVPKQLLIEPRVATDPKERRYLTASPFDSATHFEILKGLEQQFKD